MSRGPGQLQNRILTALRTRPGRQVEYVRPHFVHPPGAVGGDWMPGGFYLAAGVHDLRVVSRELGDRIVPSVYAGMSYDHHERASAWRAAFSRAVRTLEARGLLEFPQTCVPVAYADPGLLDEYGMHGIHRLSGGLFLFTENRQRRFARLC